MHMKANETMGELRSGPMRKAEFESLTAQLQTSLYQAARSMLPSDAAAEDAVLETYLQAWRCFGKFETGTNCGGWMFRILLNVVRHERRKWAWRFRSTSFLEDSLPAPPLPSPHLKDCAILAALREIPPRYAHVVILSDVHDFTYKEIQASLGVPIGTVMSRLSRGRDLLRRKLLGRALDYGIFTGKCRNRG